jgi:hypothetical protein
MSASMKSERNALVKAGRVERASSSRRAKILAIGAGVAVGATVTTASTAAAATAASSTSIPVSAVATGASFAGWKMVVVAAGLLAASGVAAVAVAVNERAVPPPRVESSRMASPPGPTSTTTTIANRASEVPTMSVGDLPSAKDDARKPARASAPSVVANDPAPVAAPPSLADEMKSAEAIRAASREGRTADAIRLLDEHDARFPNGALAEETLVLRIETFAKAARAAEAKALADKFLTERPKSPYAPRVRSTMSRLE